MACYRTFIQHLNKEIGPKRIPSLDGGGLRGMMSLQVLYRLESLLKDRFNDQGLCLADYHYSAMSLEPMQVYRGTAIRTPTAKDGTQRGDKGAAYCR